MPRKKKEEVLEQEVVTTPNEEVQSEETVVTDPMVSSTVPEDQQEVAKETDQEKEIDFDEGVAIVSEKEVVVEEKQNVSDRKKAENYLFYGFEKDEAAINYIDKNNMIGIIFYRRYLVRLERGQECSDETIDELVAKFQHYANIVIHKIRIQDVIYKDIRKDSGFLLDMLIPYTERTDITLNNLDTAVRHIEREANIKFKTSVGGIANIIVDTTKDDGSGTFAKGFVAMSRYGFKENPRIMTKAGFFIDEQVGHDRSHIMAANIRMLNQVKVCTFTTDEKMLQTNEASKKFSVHNYWFNVRDRCVLVIYKFNDIRDNKCIGTQITTDIKFEFKYSKYQHTYFPIGFSTITEKRDFEVEHLTDVLKRANGTKIIDMLCQNGVGTEEMKFEESFIISDMEIIDENFIKTVSRDDSADEETPVDSKTDTKNEEIGTEAEAKAE